MRYQKFLKGLVYFLIIVCSVVLIIDAIRLIKIEIHYINMNSTTRISASSTNEAVRYEPTEYKIKNKEQVLKNIEEFTAKLKNDNSKFATDQLFEIGGIYKVSYLFINYEQYMAAKYKLLNIIDELPKLYKVTIGYTSEKIAEYFDKNSSYIEQYYGITTKSDFENLVKSLSFLKNTNIKMAELADETVNYDTENNILTFSIILYTENGDASIYSVKLNYFKTSEAQVVPYLSFTKDN